MARPSTLRARDTLCARKRVAIVTPPAITPCPADGRKSHFSAISTGGGGRVCARKRVAKTARKVDRLISSSVNRGRRAHPGVPWFAERSGATTQVHGMRVFAGSYMNKSPWAAKPPTLLRLSAGSTRLSSSQAAVRASWTQVFAGLRNRGKVGILLACEHGAAVPGAAELFRYVPAAGARRRPGVKWKGAAK